MKKKQLPVVVFLLLVLLVFWHSAGRRTSCSDTTPRIPSNQEGTSVTGVSGKQGRSSPRAVNPQANGREEPALDVSGIIEQTNSSRRQRGLPPLEENERLDSAAESKLDDMFTHGYFAHVSPSGKGVQYWAKRSGYDFMTIGENLATGDFQSDAAVVQDWMQSPGHRENILNPAFSEIGVAVGKGGFQGANEWLVVQIFAKPARACPQIDPKLKEEIENLREEANRLESELSELQDRLEASRPAGRPTAKQLTEYNDLVRKYNSLVSREKEINEELEQKVTVYNQQVSEYNACSGG